MVRTGSTKKKDASYVSGRLVVADLQGLDVLSCRMGTADI